MSEENVDAFKRGTAAMNRGDIQGMLEVVDPGVVWRDVINVMLGGETTLYRGHRGVRELFRDLYESFAEIEADYRDFRDLGERVVALGDLRIRGKESGAETNSPVAALTEWKDGKTIRVSTYLDHSEALEAAGLSE
jgi:ketosteroid isomerase-like protein